MVMGNSKNSCIFDFVILLKLQKYDAHEIYVFYRVTLKTNRRIVLSQGIKILAVGSFVLSQSTCVDGRNFSSQDRASIVLYGKINSCCIDRPHRTNADSEFHSHFTRTIQHIQRVLKWSEDNTILFGLQGMNRHFHDCFGC